MYSLFAEFGCECRVIGGVAEVDPTAEGAAIPSGAKVVDLKGTTGGRDFRVWRKSLFQKEIGFRLCDVKSMAVFFEPTTSPTEIASGICLGNLLFQFSVDPQEGRSGRGRERFHGGSSIPGGEVEVKWSGVRRGQFKFR